jgi:hypothetical protein
MQLIQKQGLKLAGVCSLIIPLLGCDGGRAKDSADCAASQQLYRKLVAAMCVPWSENREEALVDLIDATRDYRLEEGAIGDLVSDWANDITPTDCVKAGYSNPGTKPLDPVRERIRKLTSEVLARVIKKNDIDISSYRREFKMKQAKEPKCILSAKD